MKGKLSLILLSCTCIMSLVLMIVALYYKPSVTQGEFTPPPFEVNAQLGKPTVDESLGYTTLENENMSFSLSIGGKPIVKGDTAEVYLTNHAENNVWIKLRVLDESSNILAETGLIKPNEYVRDITFDIVPNDNQNIILKIMSYEMDSYYSKGAVSLNTTIRVEE